MRKALAVATILTLAALGLSLALGACGEAPATTTLAPTTTSAPTTTTTLAPTTTTTTLPPGTGDWPAYHHDMARSGISDYQEPLGVVQEAWTSPDLGNFIYAQPLIVGDQVIVATEGNQVFSLDAVTGEIVWQVSLGAPVDGGTLPCGNINPSGITGTPVIDTENGVIYVVAFLSDGPHHQLFALDLADGTVQWDRAIDPPDLSPKVEQQRGALTLTEGMVYVPFGGLAGDCGAYKGAVVGVPADGTGELISYIVPTERMGGIWNPTGVPVDAEGNLWVATGNTASRSTFDYGNAVLRMSPDLKWLDYFAPSDWVTLNRRDLDINTTAPVLLENGRVLIVGKNTTAYLLDAANLGEIGGEISSISVGSAAFGTAIAQRSRVFVPCTEALVALDVVDDQMVIGWSAAGRSGSPIIAARHVWTLTREGVIRALDPVDGTVVYSLQITQAPTQFATLSAANGQLYVADGTAILALSLH